MASPSHFNWTAAFVEYCKGTPIEDIATVLDIPEDTVRRKMHSDRWEMQRTNLPLPATLGGGNVARDNARMEIMLKNREENYELWRKLRDDAARVITDLVDGRLAFKKYWHNKGQIVEHVCEPTMADRTSLANYLQLIANGSYAALGDRGATTGAKDEASVGAAAAQAPAITIVLPGAVSVPRDQRQTVEITSNCKAEVGPVVDVESRDVVDS